MLDERTVRRTFDAVMLALAVAALIVAFVHLRGLDGAVTRIEKLQQGLSTQYLGEYPVFFPRIAKVVAGAQRNLIIACDFPAYGALSQPLTAEDYFHAIRTRQSTGVNVEAIVMNRVKRKALLEALFTKDQWTDWRSNSVKKVEVERFLKLHATPVQSVVTRDDLLRVLASVHDETLRSTFLNRASQTPEDMPIYFWIADCKEAVFSIASPADGTEHGFYSSDKSLIKGLVDVRKRYVTNAAIAGSFSKPCD